MRTLLIALAGAAAVAGLLTLSRLTEATARAFFVFLAFAALTLTVALVIASGFAAWQERRRAPTNPGRSPLHHQRMRCGSCRRPMKLVGNVSVCSTCDEVTA